MILKLVEGIMPMKYVRMTCTKARTTKLLREPVRSSRLDIIAHGEDAQEGLNVATYEALFDAVLRLKIIASGEADVHAGRTVPQSEAFARVRRRLSL